MAVGAVEQRGGKDPTVHRGRLRRDTHGLKEQGVLETPWLLTEASLQEARGVGRFSSLQASWGAGFGEWVCGFSSCHLMPFPPGSEGQGQWLQSSPLLLPPSGGGLAYPAWHLPPPPQDVSHRDQGRPFPPLRLYQPLGIPGELFLLAAELRQ